MITKQTQIKLNLPEPLKAHAEKKAKKFGMTMAAYIRHLIVNDEEEYPVYQASKATERAYWKAMKAEKEGKLIEVTDLDKFFKEL